LPAFCQVNPSAEGGSTAPEDDSQMMTPALVSGIAYPSVAGADMRSNFLDANLSVKAGYTNNILVAQTSTPVNDYTYTISPTFTYDRITTRQHMNFIYSPGFTFYEPDSVLDSTNQSANFTFQERLSPSLAFDVTDSFLRTSDVFAVSFPFSSGVGGTTQSPVPAALAPFEEQTANNASGAVSYQFGAHTMVGAGGTYSIYDFTNPGQTQGLYNSSGGSVSAFYDRRFARNQYAGLDYQYSRNVSNPSNVHVTTEMQTLLPFYTLYFNRNFSVSAAVGLQNTNVTGTQQPAAASWLPAVVLSLGWQGYRTSLAANYLHTVNTGEGISGAYKSNSFNSSGTWRISRTWRVGASAGYNTINATQLPTVADYQGGSTFTGGMNLGHTMGNHFTAAVEYDRLQENFAGIPVIAASPDSDREYVTVTYQFQKPLGR
jgi:hypothetical protein